MMPQISFPFIFPNLRINLFPYNFIAGIAIVSVGFFLLKKVRDLFAKASTPLTMKEKPKSLLTTGLFGVTRNPVYLSFMITTFGVAILSMNVMSFVIWGLFFCLWNFLTIPHEEAWMEQLFGVEYLTYTQNVRRWF